MSDEFQHYELGSVENMRVDGMLKWIIRETLRRSDWIVQGRSKVDLKNPAMKQIGDFLDEQGKLYLHDGGDGCKKDLDQLTNVLLFMLNRDSYYRDRFILMMLDVQRKHPFNESDLIQALSPKVREKLETGAPINQG